MKGLADMVTSNLGACESFVADLRRSNIIERGQLEQVITNFLKKQPRGEPAQLADYLVHEQILSQFQANRILQGKPLDMVLGPYVLMDTLGAGSMGTVYLALSKNDQNCYAIKVLPRRSMWNVLIAKRQVRACEQCKHPAVVPFVDVGTAGGAHYLVWPHVEGEGLDHLLQRQGRLAPGLAAYYVRQVAAGLADCHQQGLVHGMIKPSNLMVDADQNVKILDFGIGALLVACEGESLVDTMSMANTQASGLDCVSPESVVDPANLTPPGDQYSLGCVLYYCLAGQYPFPEETAVEKMVAHQTKQPRPVRELAPETPEELVEIVERLMQKSPENRFSNTRDVVNALEHLADPAATLAPIAAVSARLRKAPVVPDRRSLAASPEEPAREETPSNPEVASPGLRQTASSAAVVPEPARKKPPPAPEPTRQPVVPPAVTPQPKRPPLDESTLRLLRKSALATASAQPFLIRVLQSAEVSWQRLSRACSFAQRLRTRVDCTVFAPPAVSSGESFDVCVFVQSREQTVFARKLAQACGEETGSAGVRSLDLRAARAARLTFQLTLAGFTVDEPTQSLLWFGWPDSVRFHVHAPGQQAGSVIGIVSASRDGVPIGEIHFKMVIQRAEGAATPSELVPAGYAVHRYT